MFERFTERARQVVVLAQDEARALKHNYIGTEHLLLALVRERDGVAAQVLPDADIVRDEVLARLSATPGVHWDAGPARSLWAGGFDASLPGGPLLIGCAVAAIGFPLGLLVGWLIWA